MFLFMCVMDLFIYVCYGYLILAYISSFYLKDVRIGGLESILMTHTVMLPSHETEYKVRVKCSKD